MQTPITPPPEGTPIELEPLAVSQGTMVDDFGKPAPGAGLRRVLLIVAVVIGLGLTGLAIVLVLGARELSETTSALAGEASELIEGVTEKRAAAAALEPVASETIAPTGKTVPGMVFIDSIPADAEVQIEGKAVGRTPLMLGRPFEGDFVKVRVSKPGYHPWNGKVQVVEKGVRADITLKPR